MSDDLKLRTQLEALLRPFMDDHREAENWRAELEDRLQTIAAAIGQLGARLDRLEAAVVIQTGTVFGAQGDSDRMTVEHTIPEPPLNDWKA